MIASLRGLRSLVPLVAALLLIGSSLAGCESSEQPPARQDTPQATAPATPGAAAGSDVADERMQKALRDTAAQAGEAADPSAEPPAELTEEEIAAARKQIEEALEGLKADLENKASEWEASDGRPTYQP